MHTLVASNGVWCSELIELVTLMENKTSKMVSFASMARFVEEIPWHGIKRRSTLLTARLRASSMTAGTYKGNGADCLTLYRVLAYFAETVLLRYPELRPATESFLALCWVLEMVFSPDTARRNAPRTKQDVVTATERHLQLRRQTAPGLKCNNRHKHHQELHIGLDWLLCGGLNCFVHERKNKVYKQCVQHVCNSDVKGWSRTLCKRMLHQQMLSLRRRHQDDLDEVGANF